MPVSPGSRRLHAAKPASATPINIVEFARAKRPTILTAGYWTNVVTGLLGLVTFMAALVFDPTDPTNADANRTAFAALLWTSLGLFLLFGAGLYAARRMSSSHPVYKGQAKNDRTSLGPTVRHIRRPGPGRTDSTPGGWLPRQRPQTRRRRHDHVRQHVPRRNAREVHLVL